MHIKVIVALIGLLAFSGAAPLLAAEAGPVVNPAEAPNANDPTVSQVYDLARAGHLDQARQMMDLVLANHPHSARAHYVAAQLDADLKNYGQAKQELKSAEDINPGLPFANPQAVDELRKQISDGEAGRGGGAVRAPAASAAPAARTGTRFPWALVWVAAAVLLIVWLLLRRRQVAAPVYSPYPGPGSMPNAAAGPGGVMPPGGFPSVVGGGGSGLVGNLASGLAVGAGIAAGEELVRHAFDNRAAAAPMPGSPEGRDALEQREPPAAPDLGGSDFGINDGGGWDDGGGVSGGDGGDWT